MIAIIGESGSGKSTLQEMLIKNDSRYKKVIKYTTRPKRENEKDGVDYHFISESRFEKLIKKDFFAEYAKYRDWFYGIAKEDCVDSQYSVAILTPVGLRTLLRLGVKVTSIYLYADRRSRLINILARGDNVDEAYRRNLSEVGQFDGIVDEVNYVIDNTAFHMDEEQVFQCLYNILNYKDSNSI